MCMCASKKLSRRELFDTMPWGDRCNGARCCTVAGCCVQQRLKGGRKLYQCLWTLARKSYWSFLTRTWVKVLRLHRTTFPGTFSWERMVYFCVMLKICNVWWSNQAGCFCDSATCAPETLAESWIQVAANLFEKGRWVRKVIVVVVFLTVAYKTKIGV